MVNQAFRMKIAKWSEKEEKEKENTRERSVPDGSDKNAYNNYNRSHIRNTSYHKSEIQLITYQKCNLSYDRNTYHSKEKNFHLQKCNLSRQRNANFPISADV